MMKMKSVLKPLLVTLLLVFVFRLGTYTPLFGFDGRLIARFNQNNSWSLLGLGSNSNLFTYFALGVTPFISASILMQFLQLMPPFSSWKEQDKVGRKKQLQLTRAMALVFGGFQIATMLQSVSKIRYTADTTTSIIGPLTTVRVLALGLVLLAGTFFLSYLSDVLTRHGLGNGQSVVIAAGILASVSRSISDVVSLNGTTKTILTMVFVVSAILVAVLHALVVKLPLLSQRTAKVEAHDLPLRLNPSGMLPILFASILLQVPAFFGQWISVLASKEVLVWTNLTSYRSMVIYAVLILGSSMLYNTVQVKPTDIMQQLGRGGQFIDGVPLTETSTFVGQLLRKMGLVSGLILVALALAPLLVLRLLQVDSQVLTMLGSAMIIVVTTVADMVERSYQLRYEAQ